MRNRMIKSDILDDPHVAGLSDAAYRLFQALWMLADDKGTAPAGADWLKRRVFWKKKTPPDVESLLDELASAKPSERDPLILKFEYRGEMYVHIPGFPKHQTINRPSPPKYPVLSELSEDSVSVHGALSEDSRPKRKEKKLKEEKCRVASTTEDLIQRFNQGFGRNLSAEAWTGVVGECLDAGWTHAQMKAVVWWAAEEWGDDEAWRRKINPKTLFKQNSNNKKARVFAEYLSEARDLWVETQKRPPPWEQKEQSDESPPTAEPGDARGRNGTVRTLRHTEPNHRVHARNSQANEPPEESAGHPARKEV